MIAEGFLWLTRVAPGMRRVMWRGLFEALAASLRAEWWTFMNYGYHDPATVLPELTPIDRDNRYAIHLYLRVVDEVNLAGKDVLEVGSGRGGGAAAIARYCRPRRMLGLDISQNAVTFCRRVHKVEGLEFQRGEAERLPLPDASFDAVVNVESSFCYTSMDAFLAEVSRVLRPGGHFLFADIRLREEMADLEAALARSGLEPVREADITANVVAALALDAPRRRAESRNVLPWPAQGWLDTFIGVAGTRIPDGLSSGRMVYVCHRLRKPLQENVEVRDKMLSPAAAGGVGVTV